MLDFTRIFLRILFSIQGFYQICRNLSLDVVLGALVMNAWIAKIFQIRLSWENYAVLGLTVWLIYTLDHLIDSGKLVREAHSPRHRFHQLHSQILWIWGGIVLLLDVLLSLFALEKAIFFNGCWVLGFTVIHFLLGQIESLESRLFFQKEVRIACVYVLGVGIAPFSLLQVFDWTMIALPATQVFLYAWINLTVISWYELEIDQADEHNSMAILLGRRRLSILIWSGLVLLMLSNFYSFYLIFRLEDKIVLCLMTASHGVVWLFKEKFKLNEYYRIVLDASFLLPLISFF
jgi:hypothetical protein